MKCIEHRGELFYFPSNDKQRYDDSFARLLKRFSRLIDGKAAVQVRMGGHEFADWQQIGAIALMEAVERYNPGAFKPSKRGQVPRSFFSYFTWYLIKRYQRYHSTHNLKVKLRQRNDRIDKRLAAGLPVRAGTKKISPLLGRFLDDPTIDISFGEYFDGEYSDEARYGRAERLAIAKKSVPSFDWQVFLSSLSAGEKILIEGVLNNSLQSFGDMEKIKRMFRQRKCKATERGIKKARNQILANPQLRLLTQVAV